MISISERTTEQLEHSDHLTFSRQYFTPLFSLSHMFFSFSLIMCSPSFFHILPHSIRHFLPYTILLPFIIILFACLCLHSFPLSSLIIRPFFPVSLSSPSLSLSHHSLYPSLILSPSLPSPRQPRVSRPPPPVRRSCPVRPSKYPRASTKGRKGHENSSRVGESQRDTKARHILTSCDTRQPCIELAP